MDSDDEFYGAGSIRAPKPARNSRERFLESSNNVQTEEANNGSENEHLSEAEVSIADDNETDNAGSETEGSTTELEDDPLSDVWDSADNDDDNVASEAESEDLSDSKITIPQHEFITVKTVGGQTRKVDMTPPEVQLEEAVNLRYKFYRKKEADDCLKQAIRCLAYTKIVFGHDAPWKLADCHAWLAKVYWELKEYPLQTQHHAQEANKLLLKAETVPPSTKCSAPPEKMELLEIVLSTYYLLGKSLLVLKRISEAEQNFLKAEKILNERKNAGPMKDKNFWTVEIYSALSRVKICQHSLGKAFEFMRKIKELMEKRYGEDSVKLIPVFQEMAKLKQNSGSEAEQKEAVELCLKVYSITKANYDDDSEPLAEAAKTLALTYGKLNTEEAEIYTESYFNEAIGCFQLLHGNLHPKTLKTEQLLAKHFATTNRPQQAINLFSPVMPKYLETFGELSSKTAEAYKLLAGFWLQTGNTVEGAKNLKKAVEIQSKVFGANNSKTQATKQALDVLLKNPSTNHLRAADSKLVERPRFQPVVKIS